MEELLRTRRYLRRVLARDIAQARAATDKVEGKVASSSLQESYRSFKENHEALVQEVDESEFEEIQAEFEEISDEYREARVELERLEESGGGRGSGSSQSGGVEVRLPSMELPVFYGKSTEWPSFVDLFRSIVEEHQLLSPAQKLQYLKSAMRGEAVNILRHLPTTDAAYKEAWTLLTNRYQNTREIVNAHLERLFGHEKIAGNARSIRQLLDNSNECQRALQILEVNKEDAIMNFLLSKKLDNETRKQWELSLGDDKVPPHADMLEFLERRARAMDSQIDATSSASAVTRTHKESKCPACSGPHIVVSCEKFKRCSVPERKRMLRSTNLCYNCLREGHVAQRCPSRGCRYCEKRHHSLLHEDVTTSNHVEKTHGRSGIGAKTVLLATAWIGAKDARGRQHKVRALLDQGSTVSFVTETLARKLRLPQQRANLTWAGVGGAGRGRSTVGMDFTFASLVDPSVSFKTRAFVTTSITGKQPANNVDSRHCWNLVKDLRLADKEFYRSQPVDVLLGADVIPRLLKNGIKRGGEGMIAQNTSLGWVVFGSTPEANAGPVSALAVYPALEEQVQRFWKIEEFQGGEAWSKEEVECEAWFQKTCTRGTDGRYIVSLPFKSEQTEADGNRSLALKRFLSLERKLQRDKKFREDYVAAIRDYQEQQHMEVAPEDEEGPRAYLPHHAVIREDHTTTKLRVVFDASAKLPGTQSLNDKLMNGAKLQDDLFDILIRFRQYKYAVAADVEKMYRQVWLHPADRKYQRIFWREDNSTPIREYQLATVTFGVKTAPYLATRVLQQLADDEEEAYPLGAAWVRRDFYIDDLLSGADGIEEVRRKCEEVDGLMRAGGFTLRKWVANDVEALDGIDRDRRIGCLELAIDEGDYLKTLGLRWNPHQDIFAFNVGKLAAISPTKRSVLSDICRTFDPLGWLAPFTIRGKILFQELWKTQCRWDDPIPDSLRPRWEEYKQETGIISTITIPRRVVRDGAVNRILCGFADASEQAYGAAVYLRCESATGQVGVQLVAARTRVAPLKFTSIPRLELNAAVLLARLLKRIGEQLEIRDVRGWTDSTVVLAWIRSEAARWKPYVAHRVSEIQEMINTENWHHVPSQDNPADYASRGISAVQLRSCGLWWTGPDFLYSKNFELSSEPSPAVQEVEKEKKSQGVWVHHVHGSELHTELLNKYSSLQKLLRVTAYILRFVRKRKQPQLYVSLQELEEAEKYWVHAVQRQHFSEEIALLTKGREITAGHIINLSPFIDKEGLLRVGGRLGKANLSYNQKYPILLPQDSHFTELVIHAAHLLNCHAGPTLLLAILRRKYWVTNGRKAVRKIVIRCLSCHRLKAKGLTQYMADLPQARINPSPPFAICGVDYAGPIVLKNMVGRKGTFKGYIAVFICFVTKAIHIELVSALTAQAFIAALRRFTARRGLCQVIYSDCGTNFVGANRELKQIMKSMLGEQYNQEIAIELRERGIQWKFNPPGAPHFGGLWEAGVKSVKTHLYRILGNIKLNFEEMNTVLCQIEACLNSRPLSELSADPTDLEVLTPGHFLIMRPLTAIPEPDKTNISENRLARFELCQKLVQHFWKRWSAEYLTKLQRRPKWIGKKRNLEVGQLVLLIEENLSPLRWKRGRIVELHPGPDQIVRVVSVVTENGIKKRAVTKIAPLPVTQNNEVL